jgi:hypothetical protein
MAQSALTVTPENPTPPTNYSFVGTTPPTDPLQAQVDDGAAGSLTVFAAKLAAAGAGTSVDHEGKGTEVTATAASTNPSAIGQLVSFSCGPVLTPGTMPTPNASHPSCLSNASVPTIGSLSAGGASGVGTTLLTVTGTNFNRASVVNVNGVPQTTNYASPTSLTVTNAPKKSSAGNVPVTVTSGGSTTAPTNWVFT